MKSKINLLVRAALLFVFLSFPFRLRAMEISGTVRDSISKQILSDVIVTAIEIKAPAFTDVLGNYTVSGLQAGKISLRYFRIGYEAKYLVIDLNEEENKVLNVQLVPSPVRMKEIIVSQNKDLGQSLSAISQADMLLRPTNSAQDMLRLVPGLFIAQHAGGGKAEQIFLRGFDCDHGTDFALSIDGIPVNMVSHAHGQGYADFHFVIPETVDRLQVNKGPYSARFGDFATSGAGEFFTKNAIDKNEIRFEYGRFDTYRLLGMFGLPPNRKILGGISESGYIAAEYFFSNSYFNSKQDFSRYNVFGKYNCLISPQASVSFTASSFSSSWDASGQIPERAIREGIIDRFGSIDNTEGGSTSRSNANLIFSNSTKNGGLFKNQLYYSYYQFNLYSNFTFFLRDSIQGDQIRQSENGRSIYGYKGSFEKSHLLFKKESEFLAGAGTRIDQGGIALMHSVKRRITDTVSNGNLIQQNYFAYAEETVCLTDKIKMYMGLRADLYHFNYQSTVADSLSGKANRHIISPKLSFYYSPAAAVQFYLRSGYGFHSNDARSVVTGKIGNSLARAFGYETGSTFKAGKNILINLALWGLELQNELVYVGDEGIVENSGATRRLGADLAVRWEIQPKLFADADLNYNHGRYTDLPKGENFIPLAPALTSTGGISFRQDKGFSASLRYRYIDSRPANEDNSVTAKGYFLLDAVIDYRINNLVLGISVQNLLNSEWNEAQFDTESRLQNESVAVSELHFTPGTPFFIKGNIGVRF